MGVSFLNNMIVHESRNLETYAHLYYASYLFRLLVLYVKLVVFQGSGEGKAQGIGVQGSS